MATAHKKGAAKFTYTDPETSDEVTHLLAIPLFELQPIDRGSRYEWWSEDLMERHVVTVGDGVRDIIGTIRMDDEPTKLKRMLRLALRHDLTLTYSQGGIDYEVKLVAVVGADADEVPLAPDRARAGFGEWEARVHLRATGNTVTLDGIFGGSNSE